MHALEQQWRDNVATCQDEDLAADLGNDMMRLTAAHDYVEREAVKAFGPSITQFSGAPYTPVTVPTGEHTRPPR